MEIVQAVKKLNSISREPLNFRRRPILCTTLYRNPMQATNFGGTFDQLFLRIVLSNFHRRCLSTCSIPWCKKVKNDQKLKSRGGPACERRHHLVVASFFFSAWRPLEKIKKDSTFVRMPTGNHLGLSKMSKKNISPPRIHCKTPSLDLSFLIIFELFFAP